MLKTNEEWLMERRQKVLRALTDPVGPLHDKPHVIGGTYNWMVEGPVELDYFFPEFQLAVKVTGREYGRYSFVADYAPSRKYWEARTKEEAFIQDVCHRGNIPLLLITPDDPVDPYSLSIQLRHLGITRK